MTKGAECPAPRAGHYPGDALPVGGMVQTCLTDGQEVIVARYAEGSLTAFQARCPHLGAPLIDGVLDGVELTCPVHRWRFNIVTGSGVFPRAAKLERFSLEAPTD